MEQQTWNELALQFLRLGKYFFLLFLEIFPAWIGHNFFLWFILFWFCTFWFLLFWFWLSIANEDGNFEKAVRFNTFYKRLRSARVEKLSSWWSRARSTKLTVVLGPWHARNQTKTSCTRLTAPTNHFRGERHCRQLLYYMKWTKTCVTRQLLN